MSFYPQLSDPAVASQLLDGKVGVIPTDTVYGLVARAEDQTAINRLYALKPRQRQPGTIIATSIKQLYGLGFSYDALSTAVEYWPDAVSVILDASAVSPYLKASLDDLAVRIPNHKPLFGLLRQTGPLMTTSANPPKQPTATTIAQARDYFGDKVDFYVDGGDLSDRPPSTIIRLSGGTLEIIRDGVVKIK